MPRKFKPTEIYLKPDPKFSSTLLSKFINCVMKDGKKSTAQRIVYGALGLIEQRMPGEDPLKIFTDAMGNVRPHVEVRSRRVGGANYQVPVEVKRRRAQALAFRWVLDVARKSRRGRPLSQALADELMAAYRKEGGAYTKRENVHKMAEANKAFSHFAW